jgi:hypothetical protein
MIYEAFILRVSPVSAGSRFRPPANGAFFDGLRPAPQDRPRNRKTQAMPRETETPTQEPIMELWRILALALILAAGMLFVHLIVPAEAKARGEAASAITTIR